MQSIFRSGKALGLVLFFWLVCSPFQPAYPASPTSESAAMAPDQAMEEKILQHIQYGTPIVTEDAATAAVAEKAADNSAAKADVSDYPPEYGTGEIHIKLRQGWKLDRADHVTRITKEGQIQYPEELLYLDYEFPESSIEPLWGPAEPLLELKARGERLSGQSLPDLSLWYSIKPDPTLSSVKMIGTEEVADYRLPSFIAEATRRAVEILRTMPGIESVRVAAPMVRSSWPSFSAGDSPKPNWVPFELQAAPDIYNTDGDYGEYNLAIDDLTSGFRKQADPSGGDYDYYYYPPLPCPAGQCQTGGLNIWPAWQAQFKGENVAIGYVEEDWCLDNVADGDIEETACSTHEDLQSFYSNHLRYLTSSRVPNGGFGYWHGTAVLGIMAADHNGSGTSGIAPNADYYIGQARNTSEWITLVQRIIEDNKAEGAMFMVIPLGCFNSGGMAACPAEVHPEIMQFVRTLTANNFVVVTIPGNGYTLPNMKNHLVGVNLDDPVFVLDGDLEIGEYDYDEDNAFTDFEYPDGDIDWSAYETTNNTYQTLNRAASSYVDSGSILVSAGTSQDWTNPQYYVGDGDYGDGLFFSRRSRETFASYGSRVDVQARGSADATTATPFPQQPVHLYGFFSATSACWPQVTASAALVQQMYKTLPLKANGQTGDFLTSIRMRNVLVENGNPQIPMDTDPNWVRFPQELDNRYYNHSFRTNSYLGSGLVPSFLETPAEPFARIGPRPDLGRVMYAFGLADESGNATSSRIPRYRLPFENHQYTTGLGLFYICTPRLFGGTTCSYQSRSLPLFIPNEPFAKNYLMPKMFNTSSWNASLVRSPRIAGGFALKLEGASQTTNDHADGKYLQVKEVTGLDSSYFHPSGSGSSDRTNFTLSAWISMASTTGSSQYIFYKHAGTDPDVVEYGILIDSTGHLCADITVEGATSLSRTCSTSVLQTKRVYQVVAAVTPFGSSSTAVHLFIDGAKALTFAAIYTGIRLQQVSALPEIGLGFRGIIDEILYEKSTPVIAYSMWNGNAIYTLPPIFNSRYASGANPSGLIASWGFDKKDAMIIDDPVSGYRGSLYAPDGDLDVDPIEADMPIYNHWGANVPIADFAASSNGLTVADPDNSNYPPGSLASLGSQFSVEAFFKVPDEASTVDGDADSDSDTNFANEYRLLARKTAGGEVSYEIVCKEQKANLSHKYTFTVSVFNQNGQQISATSNEIEVNPTGDVGVDFPVLDKSWAHLLITYDGSATKQIKMYLNSKPLNAPMNQNPSVWGAPKSVASPLIIGKSLFSSDLKWPSEMAFVRFYSSVLNLDNAKFLYSNRSSLWQNSYYRTVVTP